MEAEERAVNHTSRNIRRIVRSAALNVRTMALCMKHPDTPLRVKIVAGLVIAYAVSPVDFIPDWIPLIGHLDDALIIPLGVRLARRMIPDAVWDECRRRAERSRR